MIFYHGDFYKVAILDLNENVKDKSDQIKSVCKMMELTILRDKKEKKSNSSEIMDFKRPDLNRLQEAQEKASWEVDLENTGLQKGWQFLKETVSKTQMQTI